MCAALRSLSPITTGPCNEIQSRVWRRWASEQEHNRLYVRVLISANELLTLLQHFPHRRCHSLPPTPPHTQTHTPPILPFRHKLQMLLMSLSIKMLLQGSVKKKKSPEGFLLCARSKSVLYVIVSCPHPQTDRCTRATAPIASRRSSLLTLSSHHSCHVIWFCFIPPN